MKSRRSCKLFLNIFSSSYRVFACPTHTSSCLYFCKCSLQYDFQLKQLLIQFAHAIFPAHTRGPWAIFKIKIITQVAARERATEKERETNGSSTRHAHKSRTGGPTDCWYSSLAAVVCRLPFGVLFITLMAIILGPVVDIMMIIVARHRHSQQRLGHQPRRHRRRRRFVVICVSWGSSRPCCPHRLRNARTAINAAQ